MRIIAKNKQQTISFPFIFNYITLSISIQNETFFVVVVIVVVIAADASAFGGGSSKCVHNVRSSGVLLFLFWMCLLFYYSV